LKYGSVQIYDAANKQSKHQAEAAAEELWQMRGNKSMAHSRNRAAIVTEINIKEIIYE
jgi:hypothetical protein